MSVLPFPSKRAPVFADIPDEKWNDWHWQLSHRLNTAEEIGTIIKLTESERKALSAPTPVPCGYHTIFYFPDRSKRP